MEGTRIITSDDDPMGTTVTKFLDADLHIIPRETVSYPIRPFHVGASSLFMGDTLTLRGGGYTKCPLTKNGKKRRAKNKAGKKARRKNR